MNNGDDAWVSAGSQALRSIVGQFLTTVCHYVGNFWYEAAGTEVGALGSLFGVPVTRTFDEFLVLAGLAKNRGQVYLLAKDSFETLLTSCHDVMPCLELQSRRNSGNKNVHYIYVGCVPLYPPARNRGRTKDQSTPEPKTPLLNQLNEN